MIGQLKGIVDAVGESHAIIDVGGVGYEVQLVADAAQPQAWREVVLTIDTHVREDAIRLYGFQSEVERSWFRTLQKWQGVGARRWRWACSACSRRTISPTPSRSATGLRWSRRRASARSSRAAHRDGTRATRRPRCRSRASTSRPASHRRCGRRRSGCGNGGRGSDLGVDQPRLQSVLGSGRGRGSDERAWGRRRHRRS